MDNRPVFGDDLRVEVRPSYSRMVRNEMGALVPGGPPDGIEILVPCPECGLVNKVKFPLQEIVTLLNGGQVQGMWHDGAGWRGQFHCSRSNCTRNGNRTVITYRVTPSDFRPTIEAMQGRLLGGVPGAPPGPQAAPQPRPAQQTALERENAFLKQQIALMRGQGRRR